MQHARGTGKRLRDQKHCTKWNRRRAILRLDTGTGWRSEQLIEKTKQRPSMEISVREINTTATSKSACSTASKVTAHATATTVGRVMKATTTPQSHIHRSSRIPQQQKPMTAIKLERFHERLPRTVAYCQQ